MASRHLLGDGAERPGPCSPFPTIVATLTMLLTHGGWLWFAATWIAVPVVLVAFRSFC